MSAPSLALPARPARRWRSGLSSLLTLLALAPACSAPDAPPEPALDLAADPHDDEAHDHEELSERSDELVGYSCNLHQDTGYSNGKPFAITVVTVDGKPVELETANAFLTMAQAAEAAGIQLRINSGFRTQSEQQYLYNCYKNCNCNSCNLAAAPGYSNHQSGHALDLNTGGGALNWLNNNGAKFGFKRTVPSENWHWEWWGGGSPKAFCSVAPPPCDRSAGGFTFSCDGPESGQHCVNVNEPADPDSWADNHFCSSQNLGMKWSINGPIAGMECINTAEGAEAHAAEWADNFLCLPPQSPYILSWSSAGPIAGQACVHWNETADPHSWGDNHVCIVPRSVFTSGPFSFSSAGPVGGQTCVSVDEPADPDTWADNFLCTRGDFGLKWSHVKPIAGMDCTNVAESADQAPQNWADNFLCAPPQTPWTFSWSSAGNPAGKSCVRWYESSDLAGSWGDNFLCYEPVHRFSAGGFTFSNDGPVDGMSCVKIDEPGDKDGWKNDYFCGPAGLDLAWSSKGPIDGLDCTNVAESAEAQAEIWSDNYVCLPPGSGHKLTWRSAGPLEGQDCLRWFEHADTSATWSDNWMCVADAPVPPPPDGPGGAAGAAGAGGSGSSAGGMADPGGWGTSTGGKASVGGAAGVSGTSGQPEAGASPGGVTLLDPSDQSSGCAAAPASRGRGGLGGLVAALALAASRRRRRAG